MKCEKDCKYPFAVTCKFKMYGMRGCEIRLENGRNLTYMPVPADVRLSFASITRFYKSVIGQKIIEKELESEKLQLRF